MGRSKVFVNISWCFVGPFLLVPVLLEGTCPSRNFRDPVSLSCWGTIFEVMTFLCAIVDGMYDDDQ